MGESAVERNGRWSGGGVFNVQPSINNARKMPSADGELRMSLLRSLWKRKKYRKMYLESLRDRNNI